MPAAIAPRLGQIQRRASRPLNEQEFLAFIRKPDAQP